MTQRQRTYPRIVSGENNIKAPHSGRLDNIKGFKSNAPNLPNIPEQTFSFQSPRPTYPFTPPRISETPGILAFFNKNGPAAVYSSHSAPLIYPDRSWMRSQMCFLLQLTSPRLSRYSSSSSGAHV